MELLHHKHTFDYLENSSPRIEERCPLTTMGIQKIQIAVKA